MKDIDRRRLLDLLEKMDHAASAKQHICVIGAAALILLGRPARQTGGVDVWRPGSKLLDPELRRIASAAGLDLDPTNYEPTDAYLQLINPGIVNLPMVQDDVWATGGKSHMLWQGRHITVVCPPTPILAAAKLVRATETDIDDVVYLIGAVGVSRKAIDLALSKFPEPDRELAQENLSLTKVMMDCAERMRRRRTREDDQR